MMEEIQPNADCKFCLSTMANHADNLKDAAKDCPVHSKPGAMDVEAKIASWQEEFGAAIDEAIGDGEGVTSMVIAASDKGMKAGAWLERDNDGSLEYLNWEVTHTISDKVGLRYVSVWKNSHRDSDPERAWGWEVRMGGQGLGVSGGVGMTKLTGYSETLNEAKTDGMKALLGANRTDEIESERLNWEVSGVGISTRKKEDQ